MNDQTELLETVEEDAEEEVYIKYDIATYPSDFTLSGWHDAWKSEGLYIPEFQREFVWTIKQSSLLVESFLLGLPVPPVFIYIDDNNKNMVIDGQQRLLSIFYYFEGFFGKEGRAGRRQVFRLSGLAKNSPYHGLKFDEFNDSDQRKLRNSVLRAINIKQITPATDKTSIYHIFERLNTGGTALKPQEIRNCVYRGKIVESLRELNKNSDWRRIIGKATPDKHQKDVELILRLLALFQDWHEYEKPMKEYLSNFMHKEREFSSKRSQQFAKEFPEICKFVVKHLGEKPFHLKGPLNSSVLDSVIGVLLSEGTIKPERLKKGFRNLIEDERYLKNIVGPTTDTLTLKARFDAARRHLYEG